MEWVWNQLIYENGGKFTSDWSDYRHAHMILNSRLRSNAQLPENTTRYITRDLSKLCGGYTVKQVQWWFVNPGTFVPGQYFRINEFSGLLNRPSVQERKSVPALFVRISEISGLSEPGLTNHHCTFVLLSVHVSTLNQTWYKSSMRKG